MLDSNGRNGTGSVEVVKAFYSQIKWETKYCFAQEGGIFQMLATALQDFFF